MLGLLKPASGQVKVFGRTPHKVSHRIGYVPQESPVRQSVPLSAQEAVLMGLLRPGMGWVRYSAKDRLEAHRALDRMGMGAFCQRPVRELSGGQYQRVMIARALVSRPELMLMDEPTASVDTKGRHELYQLLKELNCDVTIIMVSHDVLVFTDYVKSITCVNGRLHHHASPDRVGAIDAATCPCSVEEVCPVESIGRGLIGNRMPQQDC
jgi:zinc transport system ATP-binding protein